MPPPCPPSVPLPSLSLSLFAGIPLKWTPAFIKPGSTSSNPIPPSVVHHAALIGDLTSKAKATCSKLLGEAGELQTLRLRTKTNEMIIAPSLEATLVVVQQAHSAPMMPLVTVGPATPTPAAAAAGGAGEEKSSA